MAAKISLDATQQQRLLEGLKELAFMMATTYRRRVTGETGIESHSPTDYEATSVIEEKIACYAYPEDRRQKGEYTETVRLKDFLRKKAPEVSKSRVHKVAEVKGVKK
jgi:hypothetical protein